jgi:adenylate cyclase
MGSGDPTDEWRDLLTGEHRGVLQLRRVFRSLPSPPRCKLCYAPFHGIGGVVLRPWFGQWDRNAQLCKSCVGGLVHLGVGGAEVELSLLFADIRGSTGLGERLTPAAFSRLLGTFYRLSAEAIAANDGVVDKFVGDEVIGLFIPGFTGPDHAARAIAAGQAILRASAAAVGEHGAAIPVGAGVHTGVAYVGILGADQQISGFTALGDPVNTTARLASLATAGELIVSVEAAARAGLDTSARPTRHVEVRGREAGLEVVSIMVSAESAAR